MARYQVILAYDGTDFQGFQRQKQARTVHGTVEEALQGLGWSGQKLLAAGRTDTGVHAEGQSIAFDLDWHHSPQELLHALNAGLPPDAAARAVRVAPDGFHPRYSAKARCYRYRLFCDAVRNPLLERFAWRVWPPVSYQRLVETAACLPGMHDFSAFGTPLRQGGSTVRTVFEAGWQEQDGGYVFDITGNAFLYRMVRRLVAYQVEWSQGKAGLAPVHSYLDRPASQPLQGLAPPQGLTLVEVVYPQDSGRD
jgi:tRNA pseudouridine38-40 synthase